MSDTSDTPMSVMKGLNIAIQPSNHSLLLRLPTELLIHIVDALDIAIMKNTPRFYDPLRAFRL